MTWKPLFDEARWNCRGDPARAAALITQAIGCIDAEPDAEERVRALDLIAYHLAVREQWVEASALYGRLVELLRETEASPATLASYLRRHAEAESGAGRPEVAATLLQDALALWRESCHDTLGQGIALYDQLADARDAAAHPAAASAARSRAHELRIEASGSYYESRVMRHSRSDGMIEYAIHEVYFAAHGKVTGYTEDALSPRLPSVAALRAWLDEAAQSAAPVTCGDLGYTYGAAAVVEWRRYLEEEPLDYDSKPADA
jgi:hypothetical protein